MVRQPTQTSNSRSVWATRLLTILGLGVALGMVGLGAIILLDARHDAWNQAELSSANLVIALERDINRTFVVYDLSLQGAIEALATPGIDQVSPEIRHVALFDRAANAEFLGSLLVLNKDGDIVADSTAVAPHRLNLAERDYFTVQRDRPDVGLFVSRPFQSRLRNGDASIAISRRLPDIDGRFKGIVVGTLRLAYFQDLFSKLDLGQKGAVTLARTDGAMVLRQPSTPGDMDRNLNSGPTFELLKSHPVGSYRAKSIIDGVDRTITVRQIGALPLLIIVTLSVDEIYASWRQKAISIGSILLGLCAATVALILMFRRELTRRIAAEEALVQSSAKLSVIAATDGLTGLANRRTFEAELQNEWRRAVRGQTELALLMLDADWFKPFNDRYGHVEGDEVLRRIAGCIGKSIRRPSDVGARYGGEEFVALLPETDMAGGLLIAERICASIAALSLPHEGSPLGHVTVSIGLAVALPWVGEAETELVRDADLALYDAKRNGRARVCVARSTIEGATLRDGISVAMKQAGVK